MRILFLDIDGVLNRNNGSSLEMPPGNAGTKAMEPELVDRLYQLMRELDQRGTPVHIVITSTWRGDIFNEDSQQYGEIARALRFAIAKYPNLDPEYLVNKIVGWTPHLSRNSSIKRGLEIDMFFQRVYIWPFNAEVKEYVIVDDETDFLKEQMSRLVKTDGKLGLQDDDVIAISLTFSTKEL